MENDLRDNYHSLMDVTSLLLKQVDQLSQSFKAWRIPHQSEATRQSLEKKIIEALEICDILRSAADLGKSPNEMIGYYLLGAKKKAETTKKSTDSQGESAEPLTTSVGEAKEVSSELTVAARRYAGNQREEMAKQPQLINGSLKVSQKELIPLVVTKRNELLALEKYLNDQMDTLRQQFDYPEEEAASQNVASEPETTVELEEELN